MDTLSSQPRSGRFKSVADGVVTAAILTTCAILVWSVLGRQTRAVTRPELQLPTAPLSIAHAPQKGKLTAKVGLVVFSDFQCPYCGAFARDLWPTIEREYVSTGKVLVIFRNLPANSIHPLATGAAAAAVCGDQQGHFWDIHDRLFSRPQRIDASGILDHARAAALDLSTFKECTAAQKTLDLIASDGEIARDLSISSTPTFLVGRLVESQQLVVTAAIQGYQPKAAFDKAISSALTSK